MKKSDFISINDIKKYKKECNKNFFSCILNGIICLIKGNFKGFKRYVLKAKSLIRFKRAFRCPRDVIDSNKKIAVYTALYGEYDEIKAIKSLNPRCDYFIFTDQSVPDSCQWKKKNFEFPSYVNSNILKNRYLKMHPNLLFPDYDYSIYIDAVFIIEMDIFRLLFRMGDKVIGLFHHHAGVNCSYVEADRITRIGKASKEKVDEQMTRYIKEGFPHEFGFFECSIIVRKHHDDKCLKIMNTWWNEFLNGIKRDQLSFMYSVWKNGLSVKDVANLGITFWIEPIFTGIMHKK